MAEFEDKLNAILGNQEAMSQIMSLAQSLSGGSGLFHNSGQEETPTAQETPEAERESSPSAAPPPDLSALLGQLDPGMLQMGMRLVREYQGDDDRNAALLAALRPFLKEDRRAKLDRALELARVTRLIRVALGAMGGKGESGGV